ncbi:MAG: tRNA (adenosine(37)-N6)-threonylcarbamoyltransferase complex dimerization subunit type 1 TsaB [Thermoleophilaceae bacterium]
MALIGFDTSTAAVSVCLERADGELFEVVPAVGALLGRPEHSAALLPAIATLLERAGLGFDELSGVAVGCGPGAFTGLRIGIATARALAGSLGLPLHPVSSLAALALGIEAPLSLAVIDARRGEVFAALYRDGDLRLGPLVVPGEALAPALGSEGRQALAAGNGSLRFREALETAGVRVAPGDSPMHLVRALNVCRLASAAPAVPPEAVLPNYLRSPDAQPGT